MTTINPLTPAGIQQALEQVALAQRLGQVCCWIDLPHSLDIGQARRAGVSVENLLISQPDDEKQALDIARHLEKSSVVSLLVLA
jgi:recombination protein RecA